MTCGLITLRPVVGRPAGLGARESGLSARGITTYRRPVKRAGRVDERKDFTMGKTTSTKAKKAALNFATINHEALTMASTCKLSVHVLAANEAELKKTREAFIEQGKAGEALKKATEPERLRVKAAKERAEAMAAAFIARYVDFEDLSRGDLYHFNFEAFLRNIEVLSKGEVDKKALEKVQAYRDLVIDRVNYRAAYRKKGEDRLTINEAKEVKNTQTDVVLGIIEAMLASGAIEEKAGGLALVDFEAKAKAEAEKAAEATKAGEAEKAEKAKATIK